MKMEIQLCHLYMHIVYMYITGDRVYVQNYSQTIIYGERYSSFSGALLKVIHNKGN